MFLAIQLHFTAILSISLIGMDDFPEIVLHSVHITTLFFNKIFPNTGIGLGAERRTGRCGQIGGRMDRHDIPERHSSPLSHNKQKKANLLSIQRDFFFS
jgi:hypothetical protein